MKIEEAGRNIEAQYEELHRRILEHKTQAEAHFLEMGCLLTQMRDSGAYKAHWRTFEEYVKGGLRIGRREAYRYILIYESFIESGTMEKITPHLNKQLVAEVTGIQTENTAEAALIGLGVAKLEVLSDVVASPTVDPKEKAEWVMTALQAPGREDLKQQVVRRYKIPRNQSLLPSCFNCVHKTIIFSGNRMAEYLVFGRGMAVCHKHKIIASSMTSTEAEKVATGDDERSGCPDYRPGPEWAPPE